MARKPTTPSRLLTRASRIACVLALGALLAGCDKCGDWFGWNSSAAQVCRQQAPKPQ
jgi:hypothetical protein